MKGKMRLLGILVVIAFLIMMQLSVSIGYTFSIRYTFDKYWVPNNSDMFTIELTEDTGSGSFYMYDWEYGRKEHKPSDLFLLSDGVYEGKTVYFTQDEPTSTWFADVTPGGQYLSLGNTKEFGFYFWDGTTTPPYFSYELSGVPTGDDYRLDLYDSNTFMKVAVHDATPIPFPASALLFASGIIGLMAFGRVRRIS